jgi:hypothetical protein
VPHPKRGTTANLPSSSRKFVSHWHRG